MAISQARAAGRALGRWLSPAARKATWLGRWLVLAAGAFAWQAWAGWRRSAFFPPPSAILADMYHSWFSGPARHLYLTHTAIDNVLPSLGRIGISLGIAVAVGAPLGIAIGRSPAVSGYLEPLLHFGRSLPPVVLVTVFIVLFPLGDQMEVAFITFGIIWPIVMTTMDGARTVDPLQLETARAFRLSASQRIMQVIAPAAMPKFFAGLRVSVSLSLVLMVVAELAGSTDGIGYLMNHASDSYDLVGLWSGTVLLGLLGYLMNAAVFGIEHYLLGWHRGARRLTPNGRLAPWLRKHHA
jgi:ABC-type nitrate/sulfonate/bicarbonate transport system permease component